MEDDEYAYGWEDGYADAAAGRASTPGEDMSEEYRRGHVAGAAAARARRRPSDRGAS